MKDVAIVQELPPPDLEEYTDTGLPRTLSAMDSWVDENTNGRTLLEKVIATTQDRTIKHIAQTILDRFGSHLENQKVVSTDLLVDADGMQTFDTEEGVGTIYLNEALHTDAEISRVALHEIIHAVTKQLLAPGAELNVAEQQFVNDLRALWRAAQESTPEGMYEKFGLAGLNSLEEFAAELFSNPTFRQAMEGVSFEGRTIWEKLVDLVKKFFGVGDQHFNGVRDM